MVEVVIQHLGKHRGGSPVPLAARTDSALTFSTLKGCPERQYALLPTVHPAAPAARNLLLKWNGST